LDIEDNKVLRKEEYKCKFGMFEFMSNFFERDYADLIIINNALDHCIDPYRSLIECYQVLKKDGCLHMEHTRAAAVYENWSGLHKWNIDCINGEFVIWNYEHAVNISEVLKDSAEVVVSYDEQEIDRASQIITIDIYKRKEIDLLQFIDKESEERILLMCIDRLMLKQAKDSIEFYKLLNGVSF